MSLIKRPAPAEYAPFHQTYIDALPKRGTAEALLKNSWKETRTLLKTLPPEKGDYAYAPDKWTLKQVLIHTIDTERVFAYRTLSFMRADRIPLPGFNQDHWMEQVDVSGRTLQDLLKEWEAVRNNTLFLLRQCTPEQATFTGTASNWKVSVRAYFYIIAGHHYHHLRIIRERYL